MAGKPSAALIEAMHLVKSGVTAYAAAQKCDINAGTIYRSRLYKLWLAGDTKALAAAMDVRRSAQPRKAPRKLAKLEKLLGVKISNH